MAVVRVQQCDRCTRIINRNIGPEEPPYKGVVFRLTFGDLSVTWSDLCDICATQLDRLATAVINMESLPEMEGSVVLDEVPRSPRAPKLTGNPVASHRDDDWSAVQPEPLPTPKIRGGGGPSPGEDDDFEED